MRPFAIIMLYAGCVCSLLACNDVTQQMTNEKRKRDSIMNEFEKVNRRLDSTQDTIQSGPGTGSYEYKK